MVVVDLLDVQVLPRLEVHHMNVEVIFVGGRHQLAQHKHLRLYRQYRLVVCCAVLELGFALSGREGGGGRGQRHVQAAAQAAGEGGCIKGWQRV